jgi:SAM-dependent methyltransferase
LRCTRVWAEQLAVSAKRWIPAPLRRALWACYRAMDRVVVAVHRRRGERRPIPPLELRARVGHPSILGYLAAGERWADAVVAGLAAASDRIEDHRRALDFGCGAGKVLGELHRRYPQLSLHGADLHRPSVDWVRATYPEIGVDANSYLPPLGFGTGEFDLVYAWSVFTHLPEEPQRAWLRELRRVLADDGVLLVSVNLLRPDGSLANEQLRDRFPPGELDAHGFAFAPTFASDPELWHGSDQPYGHAAQTTGYVERVWAEQGLEVLAIVRHAITGGAGQQDVVVLGRTARD